MVRFILRNAFTGLSVIYWKCEATARLGGLNVREIGACVDISLYILREEGFRQKRAIQKGVKE